MTEQYQVSIIHASFLEGELEYGEKGEKYRLCVTSDTYVEIKTKMVGCLLVSHFLLLPFSFLFFSSLFHLPLLCPSLSHIIPFTFIFPVLPIIHSSPLLPTLLASSYSSSLPPPAPSDSPHFLHFLLLSFNTNYTTTTHLVLSPFPLPYFPSSYFPPAFTMPLLFHPPPPCTPRPPSVKFRSQYH